MGEAVDHHADEAEVAAPPEFDGARFGIGEGQHPEGGEPVGVGRDGRRRPVVRVPGHRDGLDGGQLLHALPDEGDHLDVDAGGVHQREAPLADVVELGVDPADRGALREPDASEVVGEEVLLEGYGPHGVGILLTALGRGPVIR